MLTHALERPVTSGFGVMRVTDLGTQPSTTNPNKRRRSPDDNGPIPPRTSAGPSASNSYFASNLFDQSHAATRPPNRPYSPALSMMQVRAEDAASKLARKTPLAEGQAQGDKDRDRDTPIMEAAPASTESRRGSKQNTKETAITILSSSESDSEPQPKTTPRLHPAVRNIEKDKEKQSEKGKGDGGDSSEEETMGESERREKERNERSERRESRRVSGDGTVRRGFMAKRGGRHWFARVHVK
jgi:hypothetical protein